MTGASECLICQQEQAAPSAQLFLDAEWGATVIPGFDVPGWINLRLRRHAVGLPSLTAGELASFGRHARDVVCAVREVTGSVATYTMIFGEAHPHFHALITPRTEDIPAERRTGDILKWRLDHADTAAALALLPALRKAYQAFAAETLP